MATKNAKVDGKPAKGTAVAVKEPTGVALLQEAPDWLPKNTARGSENVSTSDLIIPRLEIVQALSPIKEEDESMRDGDIYNSVTKEGYGNVVNVLPIFFRKEYLLWATREKGKPPPPDSFHGAFPSMEMAEAKRESMEKPDAYEVVDTPQQFCLLVKDDGSTEEIVLSMARTKNKVSRKWNSLIRMAGGDRFSKVYALHGVKEKNAYGTFYNFDVEPIAWPSKELYTKALRLYESIVGGKVNLKVAEDDGAADAGAGETEF